MATKRIALFGIFRSGTNYTRTILEWNYDCELVTDIYPWKHGFLPVIVERSQFNYPTTDIIFVTKDPFASISSLYKYYNTNGRNILASKDWKGFLRERFIIYDSFQDNSPQYRFANVVEFWNSINWNLSSIASTNFNSVHVSYRDLLANPLRTSKSIATNLALEKKYKTDSEFKVPTGVTKNMGDNPRHDIQDYVKTKSFDGSNYEQKKYLELFDKEDRKFVLKSMDKDLITRLGYWNEMKLIRKSI